MKILIVLTIISFVALVYNPKNELILYVYTFIVNITLFYAIYKWIMKRKFNNLLKSYDCAIKLHQYTLSDMEKFEKQALDGDAEAQYKL